VLICNELVTANASGWLVCPSKRKKQFAAKGVDSHPSITRLSR